MSQDPPDSIANRPPRADRHQVERLNTDWVILQDESAHGLRGRIAGLARRILRRPLTRQQEFNALLVDHLNRNMPVLDEMSRVTERMNDVADDLERQREALLARERRGDAAVAALVASHTELRAAVSVLQQATQQLKRELSRPESPIPRPSATATPDTTSVAAGRTQFEALDSHKYVGFENEFRGSPEDISARTESYLPIFDGTNDVLDVGCGRGEFLASLAGSGIRARGIDLNPSMVDECVRKGLDVVTADALAYLRAQPDASLGGLFAAQVVEHLEPSYLIQFLDAAYDKLRPGSPVVLETINPACWLAFFESYIRDITHVRPIHPDTLKYLLVASGFTGVEIQYRSPYPEGEKLQPVSGSAVGGTTAAADFVETINANVAKINGLLFTWMDYAAVGRRG